LLRVNDGDAPAAFLQVVKWWPADH